MKCWKQEKWASVKMWATLTMTKLWWLEDWVIASPKTIRSCGVFAVYRSRNVTKWSKEGQPINQQQVHRHPRLTDVHEEQREVCVSWLHSRTTATHINEKFYADHDQQASEHTVHHNLLHIGLHIAVDWLEYPCWPLSTTENTHSGHVRIRTGPWSSGRRWPDLMNHVFCADGLNTTEGTRSMEVSPCNS